MSTHCSKSISDIGALFIDKRESLKFLTSNLKKGVFVNINVLQFGAYETFFFTLTPLGRIHKTSIKLSNFHVTYFARMTSRFIRIINSRIQQCILSFEAIYVVEKMI